MKTIKSKSLDGAEVVGTSCELAKDGAWAKIGLHTEKDGIAFTISGTPRELRKLCRDFLDGLKKFK